MEVRNDYTLGAGLKGPIFVAYSGSTAIFKIDSTGSYQLSGAKAAVVPLNNGKKVALYAVESPEVWFEDFGASQLTNGRARITIDPTFAQTINTNMDYYVYVTPTADSNGLYVAQKTPGTFEVRENGGGTSGATFDYRIIGRRKGMESLRMQEVDVPQAVPDGPPNAGGAGRDNGRGRRP